MIPRVTTIGSYPTFPRAEDVEYYYTISRHGLGGEVVDPYLWSMEEALKSLAEPERLCVTLCYGGGLSHAEAAEALNTPLGTVKSHVKRGLDKLRRRMARPEGDDAV